MILTSCRPVHQMSLSLPSDKIYSRTPVPEILRDSEMVSAPAITWSSEQASDHIRPLFANQQDPLSKIQSDRKRSATSPSPPTRQGLLSHAALSRHHSTGATATTAAIPMIDSNLESLKTYQNNHSLLIPISAPSNSHGNMYTEHVVVLSSIEQCMPRAYIRVCLTYRVDKSQRQQAISRLNAFIHNTVEAKPYLSGYVVPRDGSARSDPVEIRFSTKDYMTYPPIEVRELLDDDGRLMSYNDLDREGFPPSKLHPEKVAVLPATIADELKAPVFRAQANLVEGGIVVSLYLHHCISDGTGLGLLTNGSVQADDLTFRRHVEGEEDDIHALERRLARFAEQQSELRLSLSDTSTCESSSRNLLFKRLNGPPVPSNPPGRGCVLSFPYHVIDDLRHTLKTHKPNAKLSRHDTLQALIWCHMVRARWPAVCQNKDVKQSKLLVPVNIRNKLKRRLPEGYFGAAVDFAAAIIDIKKLIQGDTEVLAEAAQTINDAVSAVDDAYIRQTIALANDEDPNIDVRDLLASNMNRVTGADLYITSWERLGLYDADLGMGLGTPDWVRKPWSRDPGSCIILPRNKDKAQFEVVIQMTQSDMTRLLDDRVFRKYVSHVID